MGSLALALGACLLGAPSSGALLPSPNMRMSLRGGTAESGWVWQIQDQARCSGLVVHDLVTAPWVLAASQEVRGKSAPLGRAVVCDKESVSVVPLWNAAILDGEFPRWQEKDSGKPIDPEEYCKVGTAGAPFVEWLSCLNRAASHRADQPALGDAQSPGGDGALRIGNIENIRGEVVAAVNSVQSNFMAPYDFLVAGGRVVRQGYAASAHGFASEGVT